MTESRRAEVESWLCRDCPTLEACLQHRACQPTPPGATPRPPAIVRGHRVA